MYFQGNGVKKDLKKAIDLYHKSATQGNVVACNNLGKYFQEQKDIPSAIKFYTKSANAEFTISQNHLGQLYQDLKDYKNAYKWYIQGALKGDSQCQNNLANLYYDDRIEINALNRDQIRYDLARTYYEYSAAQNNSFAQNMLGVIYQNGKGVTQDYKEAVKWFTKSAYQGHSVSQWKLGLLYKEGQGTPQNIKEAAKWLEMSAKKNNAIGIRELGLLYEEGYKDDESGMIHGHEKAFIYYQKSAILGDRSAQNNIGVAFVDGVGVGKDIIQAVEWFRRSSDQGYVCAQDNLRALYSQTSQQERKIFDSMNDALNNEYTYPQNIQNEVSMTNRYVKIQVFNSLFTECKNMPSQVIHLITNFINDN